VAQAPAFPVIVVLIAALVTTVTDLWKFKIYNALTIPLLLTGLAYHAVVGGTAGFAGSLMGALFGFAVLLAFYVMGGMGAGDVKLMGAVGAWLGLPWTFYLFIASWLAAGVYSVVLLVVGRNLAETWENFQILWLRVAILGRHLGTGQRVEAEVNRPDRRQRLVPFAAMMMVGLTALLFLAWQAAPR
jgi:prepilin peptidase CpaA